MNSEGLKRRRCLWQGSVVVILGIALLVSSFLVPLHSYFPASMQKGDFFTIKPRESASLSIGLVQGSIIHGTLVIDGGGDSVNFSIEDTSGNVIIAEREISNRYDFQFQPRNTGSYILIIDNDDSVEKKVEWIVGVYFHNILFLLLGVINSTAGTFVVLREKKMSSAEAAETLERTEENADTSLKPINVKLVKRGKSIRITIPKPIVDHLGLEEGIVTVYISNGKIVVRPER